MTGLPLALALLDLLLTALGLYLAWVARSGAGRYAGRLTAAFGLVMASFDMPWFASLFLWVVTVALLFGSLRPPLKKGNGP